MVKRGKRKKEQLPSDLDAFSSRLEENSDRGAALIAAALLDAQLEDVLRRKLQDHQDALLTNNGPLATFASRIKIAKAMGWIDGNVEADLDVIRDIRNRLAHSFDHDLDFNDEQIRSWCSSLRTMTTYLTAFDRAKSRLHKSYSLDLIRAWRAIAEPPRNRYLITAHFIAQHLKELAENGRNDEDFLASVSNLAEGFDVRIHATATVQPMAPGRTEVDA